MRQNARVIINIVDINPIFIFDGLLIVSLNGCHKFINPIITPPNAKEYPINTINKMINFLKDKIFTVIKHIIKAIAIFITISPVNSISGENNA